ncbi:VC2046/SO_2500 family protein [Candidatus Enterovibrio altilux]|uniref:Putative queD like 2 n=1 Tax=Candidatus Enterovibrio altilux TaxID=1927128 RepID=A0A291B7X6_9GAMM|nr:VC2046/SO_2500 family protein [Candidatus Enterovibrio luxaltus]ATF09102.1 putative queD like 2 [Candidatus Enterovibrio luxaltus]
MQIHALDKTNVIQDVQLSDHLNHAVTQGRRSDFVLLLTLLSANVTVTTPTNPPYPKISTDSNLRESLSLPAPERLSATEIDYHLSVKQTNMFYHSGIISVRLNHCISPSALHFPVFETHNLDENVYHNLSEHQRSKIANENNKIAELNPIDLYNQLIISKRFQEFYYQA